MYGIIGEDNSDVEALKYIVKRLAGDESISVKTKGYAGGPKMLSKGKRQLKSFSLLGVTRFIICYDSDRESSKDRHNEAMTKIVKPSGIANPSSSCCIVIPVQELEAWILADIQAASKKFSSWKNSPEINNPESINDPKEHLISLSKKYSKHVYSQALDNPPMAKVIDLEKVRQKCPSFKPLYEMVKNGKGNATFQN